jgi:amino acid permease
METLLTNVKAHSLEIDGRPEGLTTFGGGLAILSTILGGGIVGLPYAIHTLGLPMGIALNLVVVFLSYESGMMYMALRSMLPNRPDSLYEIGFKLLGRKAIFLNAFVNFVMSSGLMLIYLIVISATLA